MSSSKSNLPDVSKSLSAFQLVSFYSGDALAKFNEIIGASKPALPDVSKSLSAVQQITGLSGANLTAFNEVMTAFNATGSRTVNADVALNPSGDFKKGLFWWNSRNIVTASLLSIADASNRLPAILLDVVKVLNPSSTQETRDTALKSLGNGLFYYNRFASAIALTVKDQLNLQATEKNGVSLSNATAAVKGENVLDLIKLIEFTPSALGNVFSSGQVVPFASGGAFTNSIASSPTLAPMALFGEAGPEAIMPLSRGPDGSLGVRMMGNQGNAEMAREIRALREEVSMLRRENIAGQSAIAANTSKTARILDRVDNGESLAISMVPA